MSGNLTIYYDNFSVVLTIDRKHTRKHARTTELLLRCSLENKFVTAVSLFKLLELGWANRDAIGKLKLSLSCENNELFSIFSF